MQINRRQAIQLGAVALAAQALPGCKTSGGAGKLDGYIDAHTHVWSDDLNKYPLGPWATPAAMKPPTFTDDEFLAVVKPHGIDRGVLIQHAPLHGYDNSYILDCAKKRPGVFSVVAMINERIPRLKERLSELRKQGTRGIRIGPTKHADRTLNVDPPNWLKAPGQQALWKHAAELDVAVCPLLGPEFLPSLDLMCEQFPDTVCVIDHFGHADVNEAGSIEKLLKLSRHPNVYVKASGFYKFGDKRVPYNDLVPQIRPVYDAFGPERMMWASDCPYQLNNGNNVADAVSLIREGLDFLSATEQEQVLRDTAAKVFF